MRINGVGEKIRKWHMGSSVAKDKTAKSIIRSRIHEVRVLVVELSNGGKTLHGHNE